MEFGFPIIDYWEEGERMSKSRQCRPAPTLPPPYPTNLGEHAGETAAIANAFKEAGGNLFACDRPPHIHDEVVRLGEN